MYGMNIRQGFRTAKRCMDSRKATSGRGRIGMLARVCYNRTNKEVTPVSEQKNVAGPRQLWNSALKAVKGENTNALIEQFTSEMTLVAEGLCEDQARLRQAVDDVRREQDASVQSLRSEQAAMDTAMQENQRDIDRKLEDISRRLAALEKSRAAVPAKPEKKRNMNVISQVTILAAIVCGTWLLVTVLNLIG